MPMVLVAFLAWLFTVLVFKQSESYFSFFRAREILRKNLIFYTLLILMLASWAAVFWFGSPFRWSISLLGVVIIIVSILRGSYRSSRGNTDYLGEVLIKLKDTREAVAIVKALNDPQQIAEVKVIIDGVMDYFAEQEKSLKEELELAQDDIWLKDALLWEAYHLRRIAQNFRDLRKLVVNSI